MLLCGFKCFSESIFHLKTESIFKLDYQNSLLALITLLLPVKEPLTRLFISNFLTPKLYLYENSFIHSSPYDTNGFFNSCELSKIN